MDLKKRSLIYLILLIAYWVLTILALPYGNLFGDIFITLTVLFTVLNSIYACWFLRHRLLLNFIAAAAVSSVSLFLAVVVIHFGLHPSSDPYGIMTAIICNGLFSVACWEIVHQLKIKFSPGNDKN